MNGRFWGGCAPLALIAWPMASCMQIGTGTGPAGASGSGQGQSSIHAASGDASALSGTACGQDPTGQVPLCEAVSPCPAVAIDPGAFPGCGFRFDALPALDVECVCGNVLCSLGAPRSCEDVSQLLASQTVLSVCQEAAQGLCLPLASTDAGSTSGCTPLCRTECSGVPDCLRLCGC